MWIERELLEREALNSMTESNDPIGSSALNISLRRAGVYVSDATVGRLLSEFDYKGFTVKQGYRGRLITEKGLGRLKKLCEKLECQDLSEKLYSTLDAQSKDNLIDVLTARRGIEREIARLAALKATPEDIALIQEAFDLQAKQAEHGVLTYEGDLMFHQAVAAASKNMVLIATYDFIWQNGKFSPLMEYVRTSVGGKLVNDHGKILAAIADNDPHAAEQAMVAHIESLIGDVDKYWSDVEKM